MHVGVIKETPGYKKHVVAVPQIKVAVVRALGFSSKTFCKALDTLPAEKKQKATPHLVAALREQHALKSQATGCDVVSVHSMCKVLSRLGIPSFVVESLRSREQAAVEPTQAPEEAKANQLAEAKAAQATVVPWGQAQEAVKNVKFRYGLSAVADANDKKAIDRHISLDMEDFEGWNTRVFDARRPSGLKAQSASTYQGTKQRVNEFLGYMYHFKDNSLPGLDCYLNTMDFAAFIAYLHERGVNKAGLLKVRGGRGHSLAWWLVASLGGWCLQGHTLLA